MGKALTKSMKKLSRSTPKRILMLGLDNAGKTTILYRMKHTEDFHTVPTIGFNVETISPSRGITLTVWDVGGQDRLRTLWHHYLDNVDGVVFVVDSTDRDRLHIAKAELKCIYRHDSLHNVPFVVVANKRDSPNALDMEYIREKLDLNQWPTESYEIFPCCALTGDGLADSFKKLAKMIKHQSKNHGSAVKTDNHRF